MKPSAWTAPAALVALGAALPFLPSLSGGFLQWDDALAFLSHERWRGLSWTHLRWMSTTFHMGPWQPLSWLTYGVDHALWGLRPLGYRLTNLLLHAGACALAFLLFDELARAGAPREDRRARAAAAAVGALFFAVHPLRVESVCWISERRDVLCGFFYLLSLCLYARRARRGGSPFQCWLAFAAACLSKGSALTLPLTLLILDAYPLKRRALLEKIPFFAVSLVVGLIGLLGERSVGFLKTLDEVGPGQRLALSVYSLWFYAQKTLVPASLAPYYPVPEGFGPRSVALPAAAVTAVCAAAWALRRRAPALPAALAHHAVALLPMLGVVRIGKQLVSDHHSYLPGVGWGALAAAAYLAAPRRRARPVLAAAALLFLAAVSARLSAIWRDDLSLWERGVAEQPRSLAALANMAHALRAAGRVDEAAEFERRALEVDPDNAALGNNLASWLLAKERTTEALDLLDRAARLDPTNPHIRRNRSNALASLINEGNARARLGRLAEAAELYRRALRTDPENGAARRNLEQVRRALGR
ncbi:MAG: tetratricopeptide repeat protein [Elusimicrobia bacterium]|nr:tetratricopeptide repeat protein [Elusimicrobiota bacterium]